MGSEFAWILISFLSILEILSHESPHSTVLIKLMIYFLHLHSYLQILEISILYMIPLNIFYIFEI